MDWAAGYNLARNVKGITWNCNYRRKQCMSESIHTLQPSDAWNPQMLVEVGSGTGGAPCAGATLNLFHTDPNPNLLEDPTKCSL